MATTDPDRTSSPTKSVFWSTWGVPIALGALTGFMVSAASASALIDQFGGVFGAAATCLIGFFVAMASIGGCRAVAKLFFGTKPS